MGKVTGFRDFVDDLEQYCSEPEVTQWLALSTTLMLFVIVIILLSNLHKLRRRAAAGDFEAATELLLPVYWWLVVGFAMTYVLDGLYVAVWGVEGGGSVCGSTVLSDCTLQSLLVGFELGCRRCVIDGVTVFFMHAGAGKRSVRRTAACMVPWGLFVWFVEFLWQQRPVQPGSVYEYDDGDDITTADDDDDDDDDSHENGNPLSLGFWRAHNTAPLYRDLSLGLEFTYVIGVFLCYAALAVLPPHVLYRRPALGSMYYFWQTLSMFLLLLDMVAVTWLGFKRAYCVDYIGFTFLQVALGPFVLYNTLRDDSKYWQGLLDLPSEANSVSYSQSTQPSNSSSGHGYPFSSSSYSSSSSYAPPPFLSSRATVSTGAAEPSTQQSQLQRRAMSATPHSSSSSSSSSTGGGGGVGGARVTGGWFSSFRASTGGLSPYLFGHGAGTTDHGQRSQHGTQTNNGGARRLHHGFEEAGHPPHDPSSSSSSSPSSSPQFPSLASPALSVRQPMVGQQLMEEAAHELAHTMDLLSASPNVAFLHFGLLSIDATLEHDHPSAYVLGAGGAAKVYRGRLRGEPVAIKMIWSVDITAEIVSAFREEVMMLARLARHPNVVQVKGFSVMPPALCVVMELCNKGSLLDLLKDFRDAAIAAENADQTRKAKQQQKRQRKQQRQQKTHASSSSFRWAQLTSQMRGGASLDTAARAIRDEDYDDDGAAEDGGCQGRATAAAAADSDEEIDARVNGEDDKNNVGESRENSPAVKEKEEEEKKNEEKAVKIKKRPGSADDLLESPPSSSPRAHSCEEQATHFSVESRKDRSSTGSSSGTVTSRASLATVTSESSESVPHSGDSASSVGIAQGSAYRASLLASWPVRLKLARECAEALAFLHLQTPRPVMHKDVKSANFMVLELEPDPSHVAALRTEHRKKELNRRRKQAQQRNGGGGGSSGNAKAKKSGGGGGPCPLPPPRYEIRLGDLGSAVESLVVEGQEKKKKKAQRNDRGGGGGGGDDDDDDDDSIDSVVIRGSSLEALPRPQSLPFDNGDAVVVVADAGVGNGEEDEEEKHEQDRGCDGRFGCGAYDSGCSSLLPDHHPTTSPDESQHSSSQSGSRNGLNQQHRRPRPRSRPRSHSRNKSTSGGEGTASMTASGGGGSLIVGNTGGGAKRSSSAHRLVASRKHQHSTTHASFFATTITAAAAAGLESPPHEEDEDEDDDEEGVEGGLRVSESESRRHSMGSAFASLLRTGKKSAPATTPSSRPRGGSLESSSSSSPLSTTPAPWNHRSKVMDGSGASGGSGKSSGGSGSGPNQEGHSGYSSQLLPPPAYSSVQEQGCASESFSDRSLYDDQLRYVLNDNVTPQWAAPEVLASILTVTKKKKKNHARERDEEADGCGEFGAGAVTSFEDKYTTASDVYSLGVVLWEIWTCQVPFEEYPSLMELVHRVGRNGETPSLASCAEAPTRYRNLLRACWHKDPAKRPSALKVAETLRVIQMKLEAEEKEERERDAEVARVKAAEEEGKARDAGGGLTEEEWGDEAGGFLGDENESRPQAEATWWGGF